MEMRWLFEFLKKNFKVIIFAYIIVSSILSGMWLSSIGMNDILTGKGDGLLLQSSILFGMLNGFVCILIYNIIEK